MAGTLSVNLSTSLTNGKLRDQFNPGAKNIVQDTQGMHAPVIEVGTSEEVISFGDVSTPGYCVLQNLDDDNYVTYGPESGGAMVAFGRIEAGESHIVRLDPSMVLRAQADTATVRLLMKLFED